MYLSRTRRLCNQYAPSAALDETHNNEYLPEPIAEDILSTRERPISGSSDSIEITVSRKQPTQQGRHLGCLFHTKPLLFYAIVAQLEMSLTRGEVSIEDMRNGFLELSSKEQQIGFFKKLHKSTQLAILKLLPPTVCLEFLKSLNIQDTVFFYTGLYELDRIFNEQDLPLENLIDIMESLSGKIYVRHLNDMAVTYEDGTLVNWEEDKNLKLAFLNRFKTEYLQNLIKNSGQLIGLLNVVPEEYFGYFLAKFDMEFLQAKVCYPGDVRFILYHLNKVDLNSMQELDHIKIQDFRAFLDQKLAYLNGVSTPHGIVDHFQDKSVKYRIFPRLSEISSSATNSSNDSIDPRPASRGSLFRQGF